MATYLADRVIVLEGQPSVRTTAYSPQSLLNGMNRFLELLGITFRRDPNNYRPRINKNNSVKVQSHRQYTHFIFNQFNTCRTPSRNVLANISFSMMIMLNKDKFGKKFQTQNCLAAFISKRISSDLPTHNTLDDAFSNSFKMSRFLHVF